MILCLAALALPGRARADVIVLPNANTNVSGPTRQFFPLGGGGRTFQWVYSSSQLTPVVGDQITSIGFRLPAGMATVTTPITFTAWNLQVGTSLNPPGSLSATFAANQASDTVTVRSGPLVIPPNSLIGGAGPNPFFDLNFTTPFVYHGGDLLFTLRLTGNTNETPVDANFLPNPVTDTVGAFSFTATTGIGQVFNSPITQLNFGAATGIPEPSSLALFAFGGAALAGWRRWRKHACAAA
jgi:hypothetical protein